MGNTQLLESCSALMECDGPNTVFRYTGLCHNRLASFWHSALGSFLAPMRARHKRRIGRIFSACIVDLHGPWLHLQLTPCAFEYLAEVGCGVRPLANRGMLCTTLAWEDRDISESFVQLLYFPGHLKSAPLSRTSQGMRLPHNFRAIKRDIGGDPNR